MKWSFLLFSSFLCFQAIAQYPATGNKMRLGWQTTGDGLVYRGAIGDTATLDPSGINNAWMLLDTANGNLYAYRAKAWRLVSGGGGSVSDTLTGEVKGPLDSTYIDTVANIIFTTTTDTTVGVGELEYNDTHGSLIQGLKGGNVTNVIGQQIHQRVTNATGGPLTKGTAVFLHGSQGNRITVRKALATVDSTSANTFGIVAESIANNQSGYVITEGLITNMNTNALTEGAAVYLSPTVAGELTTTKPQAPQHTVYIGVCVKQNAGSGELFVKIRNGQELDELHDVRIDSLASNASLYYNAAQGVWRDTTGAVLTSDTSVFARDFQVSGTAGQVAYFNAANAVTSDTAFRWSAANKTLGINTSTTSGANIIIKNSQEPSRSTVVATQTFAADTTNWTRGTGWTFNGTAAVATAATGALTYTPALTITSGNAYEVTYTLSGYSAGTLTVAVGNVTYALPRHDATANAVVLLPTNATGGFRFTTSTFTGNLDNVSVVEVSNGAPVLLAGQDNNSATLYNSLVMPNTNTLGFSGGGRFTTGTDNNFIGFNTGRFNTTGSNNNFFGNNAGAANTTGIGNNFIGNNAGAANTTGIGNNFYGISAGLSNTTGSNNNFFGGDAGRSNTTGLSNNFFGTNAGAANTTGGSNNFFGNFAGTSNTTGGSNNFYGNSVGFANTTGSSNNFFGNGAGRLNKTGSANNFIGVNAGYSNTTGEFNIAIGGSAMYNTIAADTLTGSNNIAIGRNAADNIRAGAATNIAIGHQVDLPTSNGSNQGVYQNVLFFTGASGTGTTIAAGSRAGIKTNAPASDFHVAGEVRIDDLKPTGTPRNIVGSSSTGDLSTMAWGNGLTVSVGDTTLRVDTSLILPKVNVSGTTNYLAKFTAGNRVGNSVAFETGGEIGIGTITPSGKVHISNAANSDPALRILSNSTTSGATHDAVNIDISPGSTSQNVAGVRVATVTAAEGSNTGYIARVNARNTSYGIYAEASKIWGSNLAGSATGVYGSGTTDSPSGFSYGGYFKNDTTQGTGFGVFVQTTTPKGSGTVTPLAVQHNSTELMRVQSSGNVGIATASPARILHINETGAIRIPVGNFAQRGTSGAGDIRVRNDTANLEFHNGTSWQTVINNSDTSVFARDVQISGTANYLPKFTGSNAVGNSQIFDNGTNVGLGNASPVSGSGGGLTIGSPSSGKGLHLYSSGSGLFMYPPGSSNPSFQMGSSDADSSILYYTYFNYSHKFFTTNVERFRISHTGNVGINTTTPSRRLHVEGETRISDLTTDPATRIIGADADGDLDAITIGNGVTFASDTLKADTSVLATKAYVTDNAISTVFIPINLYAPGDTVANTTNSKAFFLVHSGLNGYCIDSYTVKAFSGSGTADIQIDKNGTGGNLQAISGTTTATKDTNIALVTGDYIRGQVFNLSGTLVGLGLTLEIKKTCN